MGAHLWKCLLILAENIREEEKYLSLSAKMHILVHKKYLA
jgi:hypothetical protein